MLNIKTGPKELVGIEIDLLNKRKLLLICIYRSPSNESDDDDAINSYLRELGTLKYAHIVLVGDFNRRKINWETYSSPCEKDNAFLNACRDSLLTQHILSPTRGRGTDKPSLVDLCLTTNENNIETIDIQAPLGKSDHSMIKVTYRCQREEELNNKLVPDFQKGDYTKMKDDLNIDWKKFLSRYEEDVDGMWKAFYEKFKETERLCIPQKILRRNNNNNLTPLDRKGISKRKKKHRLWKKYQETKEGKDYLEYCKCRNQVRSLTRKAVKEKEKSVAKYVKTNSKIFWKYVNSKTKINATIPELGCEKNPNNKAKDDAEKAEMLGKYFSSVYVKEKGWTWDLNCAKSPITVFNFEVTRDDVLKKLQELNANKSPGPDQMHPRVLKEVNQSIVEPLHMIFSASLKLRKIPDAWKLATVTPIYKNKGSKNIVSNYRPISLTCIASRIMESIIRDNLMNYIKENNLLSDKQFGFISGRSTMLQLLVVLDKWTEIIDNGNAVDVIFCDFQKAFDTVPHKHLLEVLSTYGIDDSILSWIEDFLMNRKMEVNINGCKSNQYSVRSGVPQGSVLGPLLFIIYINSLIEICNTDKIYLYADDLKIFEEIIVDEDLDKLQLKLDKMYDWTCYSMLKFHPEKCVTMRLSTARSAKKVTSGCYNLDARKLSPVRRERSWNSY